MIVEINFLQKEKNKNIVPYFLIAILCIAVFAVSGLLYYQHSEISQQQKVLQQQMEANRQAQQAENNDTLQPMREQLSKQASQLQTITFPAVSLLDRIVRLMPENIYFESYSFLLNSGIQLTVQGNTIEQVAAFTNLLHNESYISSVDVSSIQMRQIEGESLETVYTVQYGIIIDNKIWMEEVYGK